MTCTEGWEFSPFFLTGPVNQQIVLILISLNLFKHPAFLLPLIISRYLLCTYDTCSSAVNPKENAGAWAPGAHRPGKDHLDGGFSSRELRSVMLVRLRAGKTSADF